MLAHTSLGIAAIPLRPARQQRLVCVCVTQSEDENDDVPLGVLYARGAKRALSLEATTDAAAAEAAEDEAAAEAAEDEAAAEAAEDEAAAEAAEDEAAAEAAEDEAAEEDERIIDEAEEVTEDAAAAAHEDADMVAERIAGAMQEDEDAAAARAMAPPRKRSKKMVARRTRVCVQQQLAALNGYVDVPRDEYRHTEGRTMLVDGNVRSCGQDALVHGAKILGVPATKKHVYAATLPDEGDTAVGVLVDYARKQLGIVMRNLKDPACADVALFQSKGGPAYILLQQLEGVFFVELRVSQLGREDDRHVVLYDAGHRAPPHMCGAILDNDRDTPVKLLDPADRDTPKSARHVFDSLFPFASSVRVVGAWRMTRSESVISSLARSTLPRELSLGEVLAGSYRVCATHRTMGCGRA
jgi:hypothetical protein